MSKTLKEFRDFIATGNLVEVAVAFILGLATARVIESFVNGIAMQFVSAIVGKTDFSEVGFTLRDSRIQIGSFIDAVINLIIVGAVLFGVVKLVSKFRKSPETGPTEIDLLTEI